MKECRYCGSSCDDQAQVCPNCGGSRFLTAEETAKERAAQRRYENQKQAYEQKRRSAIIRLAVIAGVIVLCIAGGVILLTHDGSASVAATTGMEKSEVKEAYAIAKEYYDQGDYENAIAYFNMVRGYKDADKLLSDARSKQSARVKASLLPEAEGYIANHEYDRAIATLQAAAATFPGDTEISALLKKAGTEQIWYSVRQFDADNARHTLEGYGEMIRFLQSKSEVADNPELFAKQNAYTVLYRSQVIESAKTSYRTGGASAALVVLNQGLQVLPEDQEIWQLAEKCRDCTPVSLTELTYLYKESSGFLENWYISQTNSIEDNLGNKYQGYIYLDNGSKGIIVYRLDKKYTGLSGRVIVQREYKNYEVVGKFMIYGDGVLLFDSGQMGKGSLPKDFTISLSGVEELKIETSKGDSTNITPCLVNTLLTKGIEEFEQVSSSAANKNVVSAGNQAQLAVAAPVASATPAIAAASRLEQLRATTGGNMVYHTGRWTFSDGHTASFQIKGTRYDAGVGFWLDTGAYSALREGAEGSSYVQYPLRGAYRSMRFDLGPDSGDTMYYGSECGSARIKMYADSKLVYDSGYFRYTDVFRNESVDLTNADTLKIELHIRRGTGRTMNIAMVNTQLLSV